MKTLKLNLPLKIDGYATSVPPLHVSNLDLLKLVPMFSGKSDSFLKKIEERMIQGYGFKYRYLSKLPNENLNEGKVTSESLAISAGTLALKMSNNLPELLVHGTTTTSRYTGSQATAISGQLGLKIPAYETKAGCSTGLAGLHLSFSFLNSGYESAICVFSETLSKVIDPQNTESWFGLADGAAALQIRKTNVEEADFTVLKSIYFTDGEHINLYSTQGLLPPTMESVQQGGYYLRGDPEALRIQAIRRYKDLVESILTPEEKGKVTKIFCHQVNRQLIFDVIKENSLSGEPYWINHEYGNLGGTTIPFSICKALEGAALKKGDLIFLMSVGGGISAAAQLWRWNKEI